MSFVITTLFLRWTLKNAINRDLLVPFKYYGVFDDTNYEDITYENGKYNTQELEEALNVKHRADLILKKLL